MSLDGFLKRNIKVWCQQEMNVIGHHDKSVQMKFALLSITLEGVNEEQCVAFDLKESAAIGGSKSKEECTELLRRSERHAGIVREPRAKAPLF